MIPFEPAVRLFYSFPFAGLIAFLGLQLGVVNNRSLSRFIRFNSMQARLRSFAVSSFMHTKLP